MAVPENSENFRAELAATIRGRNTIVGIAGEIGMAPATLAAWLDGSYQGNTARIDGLVGKFLERRRALCKAAGQGDEATRRQLRQEAFLKIEGLVSQLVRESGISRAAEIIEGRIALVMDDIEQLTKRPDEPPEMGHGAASGSCWRCGANLAPPPAEVETQIEANERAASWQTWPPELFRAKLRGVMQPGDRIVGIRAGAVTLRRPDGSLLEIIRSDA